MDHIYERTVRRGVLWGAFGNTRMTVAPPAAKRKRQPNNGDDHGHVFQDSRRPTALL